MSRISELCVMVDAIREDRGYDSVKEFDSEDIEYVAQDLQISPEDVCAILRIY